MFPVIPLQGAGPVVLVFGVLLYLVPVLLLVGILNNTRRSAKALEQLAGGGREVTGTED